MAAQQRLPWRLRTRIGRRFVRPLAVLPWMLSPSCHAAHAELTGGRQEIARVLERAQADLLYAGSLSASASSREASFSYGGSACILFLGSGRRLTFSNAVSPALSPNGRFLAFWSTRSGTRQIWVAELQTGKLIQLTTIHGGARTPYVSHDVWTTANALRLSWSPDSTRIAVALTELAPSRPGRSTEPWLTPSQGSHVHIYSTDDVYPDPLYDETLSALPNDDPGRKIYDLTREQTHIFILSVTSKSIKEITGGRISYLAPGWSPDGKNLVAISRDTSVGIALDIQPTVSLIDIDTGKVRPLAPAGLRAITPRFSPDGKRIAFIGWLGVQGIHRLYTIDLQSGRLERLPPDAAVSDGQFYWASPRLLSAVVSDGLSPRLIKVDAVTHSVIRGPSVRGDVLGIAPFDGTNRGLVLLSTPDSPAEVSDTTDVSVTHELYALQHRLLPGELPIYQPVAWRNSHNETMDAMLLLPRSNRKNRLPPLIIDMYPDSATWGFQASPYNGTPLLISKGFAVLKINFRTPAVLAVYKRTEEFNLRAIGPRGIKVMEDDIAGAISAVGRTHKVDMHRICAYGHSNGGNALAFFITTQSQINCAIIHSPVLTDWTSAYFDSMNGRYVSSLLQGLTPQTGARSYRELSVLPHLDRVSIPTLLVFGGLERGSGIGEDTMALFMGLKLAQRRSSLLVYPNADHLLLGADLVDFWYRALKFFDANIDARKSAIGR